MRHNPALALALLLCGAALPSLAGPDAGSDAGALGQLFRTAQQPTLAAATASASGVQPAAPLQLAAVCPSALKPAEGGLRSEALTFELDAFGAHLGSLELTQERASGKDLERGALVLSAHGRSSDLISTNVKRIDGWLSSLVQQDGSAVRYREEVDEGETHKAQAVEFPARNGNLDIKASKNGEPEPLALQATPAARDLLSGLFALRHQQMVPGAVFCAEIYAARRMWRVEGKLADKAEAIDTKLGKLQTLRLDAIATRLDDPKVQRKAHLWVTTDDRRLPAVILIDVKGKVIRAQLTQATVGPVRHRWTAAR